MTSLALAVWRIAVVAAADVVAAAAAAVVAVVATAVVGAGMGPCCLPLFVDWH